MARPRSDGGAAYTGAGAREGRCPIRRKPPRPRAARSAAPSSAAVEDFWSRSRTGSGVLIRRSKGDQEGLGQEVAIPRGYRLRPVEAVQTWLAAAEISAGPVFRPVLKGGRLQDAPLSPFSAAQIVKHYAERAGLDPAAYAGHSLRSGFLTSAAESGASIWKMTEVSRHKSVDVLRGYVRRADLFKEHAGAAFL